LLFLCFYF
jgi:hypothetical protein